MHFIRQSHYVDTRYGRVLVTVQGNREKTPFVTYHDIGLNCECNDNKRDRVHLSTYLSRDLVILKVVKLEFKKYFPVKFQLIEVQYLGYRGGLTHLSYMPAKK